LLKKLFHTSRFFGEIPNSVNDSFMNCARLLEEMTYWNHWVLESSSRYDRGIVVTVVEVYVGLLLMLGCCLTRA